MTGGERALRRAQGYCEACGQPGGEGLVAAPTLTLHRGEPLPAMLHPACAALLAPPFPGNRYRLADLSNRVLRVDEADRAGSLLQVTAAVLTDGEGKVLVTLRPPGREGRSLWEFPGGKLEEGETLEQCLVREILEELAVTIAPPQRFLLSDHDQGDRVIRLFALRSRIVEGTLRLRFHREARWLPPGEIAALADLAPADLPIARGLGPGGPGVWP